MTTVDLCVLIIPFAIIFLLAIRELNTWYWKINKAISLLEKIAENTNKEEEKGEAIETPSEVKEKTLR